MDNIRAHLSQADLMGLLNQTEYQGNALYGMALYAQYVLETGYGQSNLYQNYNNLFGMKPSVSREKYWTEKVILNNETFAVYAQPLQSLLDRVDLDKYFDNRNLYFSNEYESASPSRRMLFYITQVSKNYATDGSYLKKWKDTLNALFPGAFDFQNVTGDLPLEQSDTDIGIFDFIFPWRLAKKLKAIRDNSIERFRLLGREFSRAFGTTLAIFLAILFIWILLKAKFMKKFLLRYFKIKI